MSTQTYRLTTNAWISGDLYEANSTIVMKAVEAKYWLLSGTLEEVHAVAAPIPPEARSSKARERDPGR